MQMWEQVSEGDSIDEEEGDKKIQEKIIPQDSNEESDDDILVKVHPSK